MRTLQEFISEIEQRGDTWFARNKADIITACYRRHYKDEDGQLLATKFAYFRMLGWKCRVTTADGATKCAWDYWALPDDLKFALDGEKFLPDEECDEISIDCGVGWKKVGFYTDGSHDSFVSLRIEN